MEIQVIGRKSCQGTRKAQRFFKDRGASFQFRDLDQKSLSPRELDDLLRVFAIDDVVDTNSKTYKDRGLAYMETDLREEVLDHPGLLTTPLIRSAAGWTLGTNEKDMKKHL